MTKKTRVLHTKLTEDEYVSYSKIIDNIGETRSRFTRKLIREAINGEVDLLTDEQSVLKVAIRQLIGIANNLNQITMAIHAGISHRTVNESYLQELKKYVNTVRVEFVTAILKTTKRWVNSHAY